MSSIEMNTCIRSPFAPQLKRPWDCRIHTVCWQETQASKEVVWVQNTHCALGENARPAISSLEDILGMMVIWVEFALPKVPRS